MPVKRLRVFAGPNGSGKSTITRIVIDNGYDLGIYVNADDIKRTIERDRYLSFDSFGINLDSSKFNALFSESDILEKSNHYITQEDYHIEGNRIDYLREGPVDDYFIAFMADYIRHELLMSGKKFSFETVMSHSSKIDFMRLAKDSGYKVYLYFVSLKDPKLNILRVNRRVDEGGHGVPEDKIISRYYSSLSLLAEAVSVADSSFIFDNSGGEHRLLAKVENQELKVLVDYYPDWFQEYFVDRLVY